MTEGAEVHAMNRLSGYTEGLNLTLYQDSQVEHCFSATALLDGPLPIAAPGAQAFENRLIYLIAAGTDGGSQCYLNAADIGAELLRHRCQGLGDDAGDGSSPAGMDCRHDCSAGVVNQHRQTIRGSYRQQDSRLIGHQCIPPGDAGIVDLFTFDGPIESEDISPMDLFDRNDVWTATLQLLEEGLMACTEEMLDAITNRSKRRNGNLG
jgi:hypothetical protein